MTREKRFFTARNKLPAIYWQQAAKSSHVDAMMNRSELKSISGKQTLIGSNYVIKQKIFSVSELFPSSKLFFKHNQLNVIG
jgi:hypothetical protein